MYCSILCWCTSPPFIESLHGNEWHHFLFLRLCSVCHTDDGMLAAFYHFCTALNHIKGFFSFAFSPQKLLWLPFFLFFYLYTPFSKRTLFFHFIAKTNPFLIHFYTFIFSWKTRVWLLFSSSFVHSSLCVLLFCTFSHPPYFLHFFFFILTPFVIVSSYTARSTALAHQSLYRPHPTILSFPVDPSRTLFPLRWDAKSPEIIWAKARMGVPGVLSDKINQE